jgi:hypothetical protein
MNNYLINTESYLLAGTPVLNWTRLGLLEDEMKQITAFRVAYNPLYIQYSDETNTRTKAIRANLQSLLDNILEYDRGNRILDRIAASPNVTIDDLKIFNIKKGLLQKSVHSTSVTPINENVTVTMQPLGGGLVLLKCYTVSGQYAHIFSDADCVQYAYTTGDTPPASVMETGLAFGLSSRASFNLSLGADQAGKKLFIYFRWYNTRHPELAGPWSALQNTVII